MDEALRNLPWQMQVALASGYAGYLLAYLGIRDGHKSIDTAFVSLVFSVIASAVLWFARAWSPVSASAAAVLVTCIIAALWRAYLGAWLLWLLRAINISWSDNTPSAWARLQQNRKIRISQIAVELDDGTWLRCDSVGSFDDAAFGPAILGANGDIALYLTHEDRQGAESKEQPTVRDPLWGDRMTYVPASRIKQVALRFAPKASRF